MLIRITGNVQPFLKSNQMILFIAKMKFVHKNIKQLLKTESDQKLIYIFKGQYNSQEACYHVIILLFGIKSA